MTLRLDIAAAAALGFVFAALWALAAWRLAIAMRRRALKRISDEEQTEPPAELPEKASPDEEAALAAALVEQVRRETNHHLEYRPDQRFRAVQQRMARVIGRRRAVSQWWSDRIRQVLR